MSVPTMIHIPVNTGIAQNTQIHYQLPVELLIDQTLNRNEGILNDTGALCITTGKFTGRCPQDRFIVKDSTTENTVDWNSINMPIDKKYFNQLRKKVLEYLSTRDEVWIRDCYACADKNYRLNIRVINEDPWSNLFVHNMFLRPSEEDLESFEPEWQIIQAPGFFADPQTDGTKQGNFVIISFTDKIILIGGTAYTGEIKKGIFSVLNFLLPLQKNVLSMHCSANIGTRGDVALFFGLSGTGKTTLSADPKRKLIGDDEHGWNNDTVFNFEGGCYAKCINLDEEKEPDIFHAIRTGALVENVCFLSGTNKIDYSNKFITENTRVSYPLFYISNIIEPSVGSIPENIFLLTCDAYGVLPPISKLTPGQAMYQFISGYTAKVAGTETGVTEPKATFSACFGAPFLPLHPGFYAKLFGEKIKENNVNAWLINTGWTGGGYGVGKRIELQYTRALIKAALKGDLDKVAYEKHPVFGIDIPFICKNVPQELLNPINTWKNKAEYLSQAQMLAQRFIHNFEKYADCVNQEIREGAPVLS